VSSHVVGFLLGLSAGVVLEFAVTFVLICREARRPWWRS